MSNEELKKSLATLQSELDKLKNPDDQIQERITELIDDIERQLENPEDMDHKDSLLERIPRLIDQFEVEHPRITGTMNRIMMALSDMGI